VFVCFVCFVCLFVKVEKVGRRPVSIHNNGAMGQLGSFLSQSGSGPSNPPSASQTPGDGAQGEGAEKKPSSDLNDLFAQLEEVLNS